MMNDYVTEDVAEMLIKSGMPANIPISIYDAQQWLLSHKIFVNPDLWFDSNKNAKFINWDCVIIDFSEGNTAKFSSGNGPFDSYQDAINKTIKEYLEREDTVFKLEINNG